MDFTSRVRALSDALASGEPLEQAAARHGVTVKELELWAALSAAGGLSVPKRRRSSPALIGGALLVTLAAGAGFAATGNCPNGMPFCFSQNTPALATELNHNFAQLKEWMEQKVGTVGSSNVTSNAVTTNSVLIGGPNQGAQLLWNSVAPGVGRTELINNRGLGGGGIVFYDRATTTSGAPTQLLSLDRNAAFFSTQVGGTGRLCVAPTACEDSPNFGCGNSTTCPNNKFMVGFTDGTSCSVLNKARCCGLTLVPCS